MANRRRPEIYVNEGSDRLRALLQLLTITNDGHLISKFHRDRLVESGLAEHWGQWNLISHKGVELLASVGLLRF